MIGYVTIGTNNLEKAKAYYDALLAELGGKRTFNSDRMQGYGGGGGGMTTAVGSVGGMDGGGPPIGEQIAPPTPLDTRN